MAGPVHRGVEDADDTNLPSFNAVIDKVRTGWPASQRAQAIDSLRPKTGTFAQLHASRAHLGDIEIGLLDAPFDRGVAPDTLKIVLGAFGEF